MNLSTSQWLISIVFDVLIKYLLLAGVAILITYGLISLPMLLYPAVGLSLLHFLCLFLGTSCVSALELVGIRPSPMLHRVSSLVIANVLFIGVVVVVLWPGPDDIPGTADGPVDSALVLASTNIIALLAGIVGGRLIERFSR